MLQKLPHRVTFKTYPDSQYWDESPAIVRAHELSNIDVFYHRKNLRYLLPDVRVILTSRATSTIGVCLMSGKPVIYIDYPDQMPLKPEARDSFAAGMFLFDGGADDFTQQLREFLSRSLDDIEREWCQKSSERQALLRHYFTKPDRRSGAVAARHIIEIATQALAERQSSTAQNSQGSAG